MGPFSIVNPSTGRAVALAGEVCKNGMDLVSQADDYKSERHHFYLGQHGSIFSKMCLGLVISASEDGTVKLETSRLDKKHQKWKFAGGEVETVAFPGKVIVANGRTLVLQSNAATPRQKWKRINTRLLNLNDSRQTERKQDWTVSFISSPRAHHKELTHNISDDLVTTCYKPNPAFSTAFDDFAKDLVIDDAADEKQCSRVREELGFEKDHPFDTEVQEKFNDHQCDPLFTGIDHMGSSLEAPPQFAMVEYTPVDYEAVEYEAEEYDTIDYQEFTRYVQAAQCWSCLFSHKLSDRFEFGCLKVGTTWVN